LNPHLLHEPQQRSRYISYIRFSIEHELDKKEETKLVNTK
jgi:hypothetical protein